MEPFWVETNGKMRLALVLCPEGGDRLSDDLDAIQRAGVDVLVSLLPSDEAVALGLASEAGTCAAVGIRFRSYPILIRPTPTSLASFALFVDEIRSFVRTERSVAVHCRAFIGRSCLFLATLMVAEGFTPDDAFRRLSEARGVEVPDTSDQVRFVQRFAKSQEPLP